MASALDEAMRRLEGSLGLLEVTVMRRLEADKRRGDLETELQIMQDDRARLALELDGMLMRLQRAEAAASDVSERVQRASAAIESVLAETGNGERE
jgi:predicted  nucleic acid-binding Zn-ribbon protein